MEAFLYILLVIVGFSFIIAIHEAGHFLAAKRAGIECPVFSVGFPLPGFLKLPPRLRNIVSFHWKGTDYRIGWIPFGGFVQMKGQEDSPTDVDENAGDQDDFRNVSYGNKVLVILGGVIMNAITGVIFFILAFAVFGVTFIKAEVGGVVATDAISGEVTEVWRSGKVKPGDLIYAVEGEEIQDYEDAAYAAFFDDDGEIEVTFLRPSTGEKFTMDVPLAYIHARVDAKLPPVLMSAQVLVGDDEAERSDGKLHPRDEVVAINGIKVGSQSDIAAAASGIRKGQEATLTIKRDGEEMDVAYMSRISPLAHDDSLFGASFTSTLKIKGVQKGGAGDLAGIKEGDQIVALGSKKDDGTIEWSEEMVAQPLLRKALDLAGIAKETLSIKLLRGEEKIDVEVTPQLRGNAPNRFALAVIFETKELRESLYEAKTLKVGFVDPESAAYIAGLRSGDEILDVPSESATREVGGFMGAFTDTVDVPLYQRMSNAHNAVLMAVRANNDPEFKTTKLKVKRGDEELEIEIKPSIDLPAARAMPIFEQRNRRTEPITYPLGEALGIGFHQTSKNMMKIVRTLKGLFTGKVSPTQLAGPVMIAKASYDLSQYGFGTLLFFLGFISINLAVVNVLPIPVLDGGLLVIVTLEKLKGGPLNEKVMGFVNLASFLLVISLMLFVVFNDIRNLALF